MPTLMNMTAQDIEQTLTELTGTWIQQNIHDFSLLKTSILKKEPIPSIMIELQTHLQTLQQQEKERVTQALQITAIHTQKTKDDQEAIADKQEENDDNVGVIASSIDTLRAQSANMTRQKEQIKNKLEAERHEKLDTKVNELINQALFNQIREDEAQSDNDQRDKRTDENLENHLHAVEQLIPEANMRVTQKTEAVQARIDDLKNKYKNDPKQLKEKTGQSAFDYVNFGNWENRDKTLQKLRGDEKKATDALGELKAKKQRLSHAIETRPARERERQQRYDERKSRKKARQTAATHHLIFSVLDALLNIQPETDFILSHDVRQQLSTSNASYLQSAIGRARVTLNHEFQASIQTAFSPIERKISEGEQEISRLTERLKGVSGRVEKRRIQAENRQKRSVIRHLYPAPSTGSSWEAQLSHEVSNKLSHDIALEQNKLEQTAKNIYSQAQMKSWQILFDFVSNKLCADADDKSINTLKNICAHVANHQQSLSEIKQLEVELSTMRDQVIQDETQVRSLFEKIDTNKKQIDKNKLCITHGQETMPFLLNQVKRSNEENASLRMKTLGYAALTAVLLITVAVVAVGFLPAGPIVGAILMGMCAMAAIACISAYMEWGTASSILEERNMDLSNAQDNIQHADQNNRTLTCENNDFFKQIEALQHKISETNQRIDDKQNLVVYKTHEADQTHALVQAMTPDNPNPVVLDDGQPSAPPLATFSSGLGIFSDMNIPVAVAVLTSDSDFSMK